MQTDIFRDDPSRVASAYREAAQAELVNPYFGPAERQRRHDYYAAEAARMTNNIERLPGAGEGL